jgi:hypothetical protein
MFSSSWSFLFWRRGSASGSDLGKGPLAVTHEPPESLLPAAFHLLECWMQELLAD